MAEPRYEPVGPCVVERILLLDIYGRAQPNYRFVSSSLPGHLIQLMRSGQTEHEINGRRYQTRPGTLIWYHEDEEVRGEVVKSPWSFFTLNFIAPALEPPPFEDRVRQVGRPVWRQFECLLASWRDTTVAPATRALRVQSNLLALLSMLTASRAQRFTMDPVAQLWWDLETYLRQDLSKPINLGIMSTHCGQSVATIARACHAAVGAAPMRRIKHVRMSLARGLVRRSELRMKEIAARVGYPRVHEFSRDYRKHFGCPPTEDRPKQRV